MFTADMKGVMEFDKSAKKIDNRLGEYKSRVPGFANRFSQLKGLP